MNGDPRFRAVLIANAEYRDPDERLHRLNGPRHDLAAMWNALTHHELGLFPPENVKRVENQTSQEIADVLHGTIESTEPGQNLLIYYSGHGEQLAGNILGLCGVDVQYSKLQTQCFATDRLSVWIRNCRAQSTIVVLDCCYGGQFKGAASPDIAWDKSFGRGTAVLSGGGNEPIKDADGDEPPTFTKALTSILTDEGVPGAEGWLTAEQAFGALDKLRPPLVPAPKRNTEAQGVIPLARRPASAFNGNTPLKGWPDKLEVSTVTVTFGPDQVVARWDGNNDGSLDERI